MRSTGKYNSQKIESIAFHPVIIICLLFISLLFSQFYLKLSPLLILAALIGLSFSAIILLKPEIGLFIFMVFVLIYANYYLNLPKLGFISFSVVLEGLLVVAVAFKLFVKKEYAIGKEIQIKLWGLYVLLIFMSSLLAYSYRSLNISYVRDNIIVSLLLLFLVFFILQSRKNLKYFFYVLLVTNILVLISSLLFLYGILTPDEEEVNLGFARRLTSFVEDPNQMAFNLISFLIISFSLFLFFKRKILKTSFFGLACLNLIAIPFTLSRGGFIALVGVLLFLYLKFTRNFKVFIILLLLSAFLYFALPDALMQRFETAKNIEKTDRYVFAKAGLKMTLANPLFGVGPGNYNKYVFDYSQRYFTIGRPPHNLYVSISAQLGIPALIVFLLIIMTTWNKLTSIEKSHQTKSLEGNFEFLMSLVLKANMVNILLMGLTAHIEHKFFVIFILGTSAAFIRVISSEGKTRSDKASPQNIKTSEVIL